MEVLGDFMVDYWCVVGVVCLVVDLFGIGIVECVVCCCLFWYCGMW